MSGDKAKAGSFNCSLREEGIFKSPGKTYISLLLSEEDLQKTEFAIEMAAALPRAAREHDHFVKTHSRFGMLNGTPLIERSVSAGAVYIIRNPADIVPSFASHMGVEADAAIEIMADRDHATVEADVKILTHIGRWGDHAESWIDGSHSLPVCVVRYEDLYANPEKAFGQVLKVLGLPFDSERLKRSIRHSSFEELRRQEEEKGFSERPPHMQRFFRTGGSGEGQRSLSEQQLARLSRDHGPVMKRFGYLP